jgi:F-type H+-transporting ATPase subunit gamma
VANINLLQRRIRSIKSTSQITRAMEMIAASKMKRAQDQARSSKPYSEKIVQVLGDLVSRLQYVDKPHPLIEVRSVKRIEVIDVTPDRGLCGGINANINHLVDNFISSQSVPVTVIAVGRRGRDHMIRRGYDVHAEFSGLGDRPSLLDTTPISRIVIDHYTNKEADRVYMAYTQFVNTFTQRPVLAQLLPILPAKIPVAQNIDYIYEPNPAFVLAELLPRFVEMEVYQAIVESIASEQSARMVAMHNAHENASDLIMHLTLAYNKLRQEKITEEIMDIIGGSVNAG